MAVVKLKTPYRLSTRCKLDVHLRMHTGVNMVEEIKDCPRLRVNRVNECHKRKHQ